MTRMDGRTSTSGRTQMRESCAGNNYVRQDPVIAHFGLGNTRTVDTVRIVWPDQTTMSLSDVAARQRVVVTQPPDVEPVGLRSKERP